MFSQIAALAFLLAVANAGVIGVADGGLSLGGYSSGLSLGGLSSGLSLGGVDGGHGHVVDYHTPAKYEFKYGVEDPKTGDRKQQSEVRVGDVVKGEYSLAEPDGTIRIVKYTADGHNGFNAVVSRVGHAVHPQVLIKKAVVPVAHSVVPVASHGVSLGGIGLGGIGLGGGYGSLGNGLGGLGIGLSHHGGY